MISKNRQEEVKILSTTLNKHELAKKFGVEVETIQRYLRYNKEIPKAPKILIFDIETLYMEVSVWGTFKQHIPNTSILKEWNVLSWSAKWLFDNEMMSDILTPEESKARDDRRILKSVWKLMEEANVIIGHNSKNFDVRKLNARFVTHDMKPPLPYQTIDTLKIAKSNFALPSYSLDYLCNLFGLTPKIKTGGMVLWDKCLAGDAEALNKMIEYNEQDVLSEEELYLRLRPWSKNHPNLGTYFDSEESGSVCPNCGSSDLDWKGYYHTPAGKFQTFRCGFCGSIGRSRRSEFGKKQKRNLTIPIAR